MVVAFLPAAVLGLLLSKIIKGYLFAPVPVALAFVIGALICLTGVALIMSAPRG